MVGGWNPLKAYSPLAVDPACFQGPRLGPSEPGTRSPLSTLPFKKGARGDTWQSLVYGKSEIVQAHLLLPFTQGVRECSLVRSQLLLPGHVLYSIPTCLVQLIYSNSKPHTRHRRKFFLDFSTGSHNYIKSNPYNKFHMLYHSERFCFSDQTLNDIRPIKNS